MYAFRPPALIPLNQGKEETSSPSETGVCSCEGRTASTWSVSRTHHHRHDNIPGRVAQELSFVHPCASRWPRCFARSVKAPFCTSSGLLPVIVWIIQLFEEISCYVHRSGAD